MQEKLPASKGPWLIEELLIAEGSDWNWWYGPEHHSANDRDFDELYRKHLSNVYLALGGTPPDALAQPIAGDPCQAAVHAANRVYPSGGGWQKYWLL